MTGALVGFCQSALLNGDITERNIPSGPFSLLINAEHLPNNPVGTLSGSGALENAPLLLDAAFSRTSNGAATLKINNALWRSLNAQADLALAPGGEIPTGTATFQTLEAERFSAVFADPADRVKGIRRFRASGRQETIQTWTWMPKIWWCSAVATGCA